MLAENDSRPKRRTMSGPLPQLADATYLFASAALRAVLTLRAYVPCVPPPRSPTFRGLPLFDKRFLQNGLFYGFLRGTDYFLTMPYFHDKNFSLRFLRRTG